MASLQTTSVFLKDGSHQWDGTQGTPSTVPVELLHRLREHHSDQAAILCYPDGHYGVSPLCWRRERESGAIIYEDLNHQVALPVLLRRDLVNYSTTLMRK